MDNLKARNIVMEAVRKSGNMSAIAKTLGCHRSFLYQFARAEGPNLGPQIVSRMRQLPAFEDIDDSVWLIAMGVNDNIPKIEDGERSSPHGPRPRTWVRRS
jgi:hypothetical protein